MITTRLPVARIVFAVHGQSSPAPILLRQKIHREMDALQLAPRDSKIARLLGARRDQHCLKSRRKSAIEIAAPAWAPHEH